MSDDLKRLRAEYDDRARRLAGSDIYSLFNPAYLFMIQQRTRSVLRALERAGIRDLHDLRLLEIGCGRGGVLLEYLQYGVAPAGLHGIDYLHDRLVTASARLPHVRFSASDAQALPFASASFDLITQYTAFSSLLDDGVKANAAREMLRVLKPCGAILWYDFWLNPSNDQTRGIRPDEIRRLFGAGDYTWYRITLAPPIGRRLIRYSWLAGALLERIGVFNSHYLVIIQPSTP